MGAVWGAAQVSLIVFVFGFGGFLAVWGGLWVPSGPDDPGNTILFALLNSQGQQVCDTKTPSREGLLLLFKVSEEPYARELLHPCSRRGVSLHFDAQT